MLETNFIEHKAHINLLRHRCEVKLERYSNQHIRQVLPWDPVVEQTGLLFPACFINGPPTEQPGGKEYCRCKKTSPKNFIIFFIAMEHTGKTMSLKDYREPWWRKQKKSRTLEEYTKYLPPLASLRNKRTVFSTNLDIANNTAAPCNRKIGEKTTGRERFLAPGGVPYTKIKSISRYIVNSISGRS